MSYSQALEEQFKWLRWVRVERRDTRHPNWASERAAFAERALELGETFYWAPEICGLMAKVAVSLPMTWRFTIEQLPSRYGFFWFASSLDAGVKAFTWSTGVEKATGEVAANVSALIQGPHDKFPILQSLVFVQGMTAQAALMEILTGAEGDDAKRGIAMAAQFASCLTFIDQRILTSSRHQAERHFRRRMEREGFTHEPLVRVVELRRKQVRSEHHGDSEPVEWSHQWIVSGHWRQQWYPSLNANQPRWIMPYVKGPEDKPLKPPRAKVFAVVR